MLAHAELQRREGHGALDGLVLHDADRLVGLNLVALEHLHVVHVDRQLARGPPRPSQILLVARCRGRAVQSESLNINVCVRGSQLGGIHADLQLEHGHI
jgi:hypothetical protein